MFYNPELLDKINDIQDEFNRLLEERNANSPNKILNVKANIPTKGGGLSFAARMQTSDPSGLKEDEFYKAMDQIYGGKNPKKHKSPTKRLMQQKNAAWTHKEFLAKNLQKGDEYSLTYVCDPKKTFVI